MIVARDSCVIKLAVRPNFNRDCREHEQENVKRATESVKLKIE